MAKVLELSFSISPLDEYSGLICFVRGTLKSLLQHHNLKASILPHLVAETCQKSQHLPQWFIPGILVESSEPHDRPLQCGPASLSLLPITLAGSSVQNTQNGHADNLISVSLDPLNPRTSQNYFKSTIPLWRLHMLLPFLALLAPYLFASQPKCLLFQAACPAGLTAPVGSSWHLLSRHHSWL